MTAGPAARPCGSCPYRRDVPSGVWHPSEYAKLPAYDNDTMGQPPHLFLCHQQDGRVCAGWAGCHDGAHLLALRFAAASGELTGDDLTATLDYATDVPLFATGADAAWHGMRDIERPDQRAQRTITTLTRKKAGR